MVGAADGRFGSLYGGFFAVHACHEHWHDDILDPVVSVLSQIGRFSCSAMFTVELRKVLPVPADYSRFVGQILGPLSSSKLIKEDVQNGGVFEFLFDTCMKVEEPEHLKNEAFRLHSIGTAA